MACTIIATPQDDCNTRVIPGIAEILLIEKEYVVFPLTVGAGEVATIPKTVGQVFKRFNNFKKKANSTTEYEFDENNGTGYMSSKIMGQLNNIRTVLYEALRTYATGVELIAVVRFKNGTQQIIGEQDAPLYLVKLTASPGTDEKGQLNKVDVEFSVAGLQTLPLTYTGTMAALLV